MSVFTSYLRTPNPSLKTQQLRAQDTPNHAWHLRSRSIRRSVLLSQGTHVVGEAKLDRAGDVRPPAAPQRRRRPRFLDAHRHESSHSAGAQRNAGESGGIGGGGCGQLCRSSGSIVRVAGWLKTLWVGGGRGAQKVGTAPARGSPGSLRCHWLSKGGNCGGGLI